MTCIAYVIYIIIHLVMQKTKVIFAMHKPVDELFSRYCYAKWFTKSWLFRRMISDYIHNNREEFIEFAGSETALNSLCNPK